MKHDPTAFSFAAALLMSFLVACSGPTGPSSGSPSLLALRNDPRFSEDDIREAQLAAMYLTAEIYARSGLTEQVAYDLKAIREQFEADTQYFNPLPPEAGFSPDSFPAGIRFRPPWIESYISLGFVADTGLSILEGRYTAWDELNERFGAQEPHIQYRGADNVAFINLTFDGIAHPARIADSYRNLEGIVWAQPSGYGGDWSNVYPLLTPEGISYLVRWGGGDCPAGCTVDALWFFSVVDGEVISYGYLGQFFSPVELPSWWEFASQNRDAFREHAWEGTRPPWGTLP